MASRWVYKPHLSAGQKPSTKLTSLGVLEVFVRNTLSRIFFFFKPYMWCFLILCPVWELSVCDVYAYLHLYILLVLFFGSFFFFFSSLLCPVPVCLFLLYLFLCACLFSTGREKGKWIWAGRQGGSRRSWVRGNHDQNIVWKKKQELLSMKKEIYLFLLYMYGCLPACTCVCTVWMTGPWGGQKGALDSQELEL